MSAYYNEIDAYCAAWLRNLISEGLIAPGDVDERDIRDVRPDDLRGYTQCHFFAGIGVWSYALRLAGWSDDRPVWTGSCPCQPFSAAGRHGGVADERHLWPHWNHLIGECRPAKVFGEQVASKDGLAWLDLVSADLEGTGYAIGASDLCAAGVGPSIEQTEFGRRLVGEAEWFCRQEIDFARKAVWREFADYLRSLIVGGFHIRQRLYFTAERVADTDDAGPQGRSERRYGAGERTPGETSMGGGLADAAGERRERREGAEARHVGDGAAAERQEGVRRAAESHEADASGLADADRAAGQQIARGAPANEDPNGRARRNGVEARGDHRLAGDGEDGQPRPADGLGRDADWLFCRDGKWRPVEPGTFPLAHGAPARVGRLRAYGNGLDLATAVAFIESAPGDGGASLIPDDNSDLL